MGQKQEFNYCNMPANKRSWTEQAQADSVKKNDPQTIHRCTLEDNQDYSEVLDITGARKLALDSLQSVTADTLIFYLASSNDDAVRGFPGGAYATGSITYGVPVATDTVLINGTTCTCVASSPGANQFSSIAELEVLADAIANINSDQDGTTISLAWDTGGIGGNSATLSLGVGNTGTMAISGATFTGGAATSEWGAYENSAGANPFATGNSQERDIDVVGFCGLIVVRTGEADGDIPLAVGISN